MNGYAYSPAGLALTESFEGCRLTAYQDLAGVWTIGYGHTGPDVHARMVIDEAEASALLLKDLSAAVECVNRMVTVPLTQGQFDALVDFAYNEGRGSLERSTLLKKVNAGDFAGAAAQFAVWDKAAGEVAPGLVRRRQAEMQLFLGK